MMQSLEENTYQLTSEQVTSVKLFMELEVSLQYLDQAGWQLENQNLL